MRTIFISIIVESYYFDEKTKKDIETLNLLYERSKEVGVETIKLNSFDEILKIEPNCNPLFNEALFIKETVIS